MEQWKDGILGPLKNSESYRNSETFFFADKAVAKIGDRKLIVV